MMSDHKLDDFFKSYKNLHTPEVSRGLLEGILVIPEMEMKRTKFSILKQESSILKIAEVKYSFARLLGVLMPRASGLAAACLLGVYFGNVSGAVVADEINNDYLAVEYTEFIVSDAIENNDDNE